MTNCNLCKKKGEFNKFSCGHLICNTCLGRVLILDEFNGLKNNLDSIDFTCTCKKGKKEISIADYISILNALLIESTTKFTESSKEPNLSDELVSKLVVSIKKKRKNMRYKTFEDFTKFLNNLESNLMKLFNEELSKTLKEFDRIVSKMTIIKENFIAKMDLKATKVNSMFVILKMVFMNLYKDYDNISDLKTLKFLSQVKSDFYKIKFTPNIEQLTKISEEIANFEKNEHFTCKFVFSSKPQNVLSWKIKQKFKDISGKFISSLLQLNNGYLATSSADNKIKIWDLKKKNFLFSLSHKTPPQNLNRLIRKIIQISNGQLISISQNEIFFWNLKTKENTHTISELKGTFITNIREIGTNQIMLSTSDCLIKAYNAITYYCIISLSFNSVCYSITPIKNWGVIYGFSNGDVKVYEQISREASPIYEKNIGSCTISVILEWKGKIVISSNENDIKVTDIKDKRGNIEKLKGHSKSVMSLCNFDHKIIMSGSLDFSVRLWDLNKMKCIFVIKEHNGWITNVIKCRDGQICSCGSDCEIIIYNYE